MPSVKCCSHGGDAAERAQAFKLLEASAPPGCSVSVLEDLFESGDSAAARMVIPGGDGWEQNPITTLLYTSGSSGRPKGAVYREHMLYGMLQVQHLFYVDAFGAIPVISRISNYLLWLSSMRWQAAAAGTHHAQSDMSYLQIANIALGIFFPTLHQCW